MLSFIVPISIDNSERAINVQYCVRYYNKKKFNIPTEFVFIENSQQKQLHTETLSNVDKYVCTNNDGIFRKTYAYNIGAKIASGDVFCFLDADVFVNRPSLELLYNQSLTNEGVFIGYNGVAIYTTQHGKVEFESKLDNWSNVSSLIDFNNIRTNYSAFNYIVANTNAVGGCLLMNKTTFKRIGGFNPNFIGWGYEDNEIISRSKTLKVPIFRLNEQNDFLIHLWHDVKNVDKSKHSNYNKNKEEIMKVESMSKQQLEEYIKTWNV